MDMRTFQAWKEFGVHIQLSKIFVCIIFAFTAAAATAAEKSQPNNEYLRGYVAAVFEGEFHWDMTLAVIEVHDRIATVTVLPRYYREDRSGVTKRVPSIPGLRDLRIVESGEDRIAAFRQAHPVPNPLTTTKHNHSSLPGSFTETAL